MSAHPREAIGGVLDGIAFQCDILALNAAIETAQGGDGAHGLALAAAEARGLARELRALHRAGAAVDVPAIVASVRALAARIDAHGSAPSVAAAASLAVQAKRLSEFAA
jgi:hypothetical protein